MNEKAEQYQTLKILSVSLLLLGFIETVTWSLNEWDPRYLVMLILVNLCFRCLYNSSLFNSRFDDDDDMDGGILDTISHNELEAYSIMRINII